MNPILAQRGRLGLYLVAWLILGALLAVLLSGGELERWRAATALVLPLALVYAFICLASWYPSRANPVPGTAATALLIVHLAAALLSSAVWLGLGYAWARLLDALSPGLGASALFAEHRALFFAAGTLLYLLAVCVHYLLLAFELSRRAQRRELELKVLAREAELDAFKAQIDPHFLFNSLNSISSLCGSDPQAARRMSIGLGDFLRSSVRLASHDIIPLEQELALTASYLEIERVRFGDRLEYRETVTPEARQAPVPALVLQPLIENALKHGLGHLIEGGLLEVRAGVDNGQLSLTVENPCDPDRETGSGRGIGLANVRGRLRLLFGGAARMEIEEGDERFRIELRLPLEAAEAGA